jgi:hypothetical protein
VDRTAAPGLPHPNLLLHSSPDNSTTAVIAVRAWSPALDNGVAYVSRFTVADAATQIALGREARYSQFLSQFPIDAIGLLLVLVGFGLLTLGIAVRRREILLFAVVLITGPLQAVLYQLTDTHTLALPVSLFEPVMFLLLCAVPILYVQFLWEALKLPGRGWKYAVQAASVASALGFLVITMSYGVQLPAWVDRASIASGILRDVIEAAAAVWAFANRRSGRLLAFAIFLTPAASLFSESPVFSGPRWSAIADSLFQICVTVGGLLIAAILVGRAWNAWRNGERLRGELDAAREVQQRAVPITLPAVPGFTLAAAYLPAAEVGGDFYQVLPLPSGATILVVGDVSGKGLKAAMTGAMALGALRSLAQENLSPARILARLNAQLAASSDGGFVTCLCARIAHDGSLAISNAGHLAPYRNGEEIFLEPALPLGVTPDAAYPESTIHLAPNDRLTFLSDGVIEARNPQGELFGFDRTRAISTQPAEAIARAAQHHGQEDDITVLTLAYAGAAAALTPNR